MKETVLGQRNHVVIDYKLNHRVLKLTNLSFSSSDFYLFWKSIYHKSDGT